MKKQKSRLGHRSFQNINSICNIIPLRDRILFKGSDENKTAISPIFGE
jgi:hypothetical protein